MDSTYTAILNPVGVVRTQASSGVTSRRAGGGRRVIALLNNSKPNVEYFLEAIEQELRRGGDYEILNVTKPRSAGPCPDLEALATQCDFVINAVAD
jgi:hypothetical protein